MPKKKPTFGIQWHLTPLCDQSCRHCYLMNDPARRTEEFTHQLPLTECMRVIDSFIEFCEIAGARPMIGFTGGDPLLRPDFFEILSHAAHYKITSHVMGNPFHLTKANIAHMLSLGVTSYQVSIDGTMAQHDSLRKRGSFESTLRAIRLLNEGGLKSVVMFTLSSNNKADLFPVMELVAHEGVKAFSFARLTQGSFEEKHDELDLDFTPHAYRDFLIRYQQVADDLNERGYSTQFGHKDHLWKLLWHEQGKLALIDNPSNQIISGCHVGRSNITILADGTTYACRRFPSPIGKVPEQSVLDVFTSENMEYYRNYTAFVACTRCPLLNYCRGCPAVAFGKYGNFYAADPQCWRAETLTQGGSHE